MAATPSTMAPLGTRAPDFSLTNQDGDTVALADFQGAEGLLVAFICYHCPFVAHIREELGRAGKEFQEQGVAVVAINANDLEQYPQDGPEGMSAEVREGGYSFPYLLDETQAVAKAYTAACTPDFFLFDGDRKLVYRGQFDDSRPGNGVPVTGKDLRAAVDALLNGKPMPEDQRASIGCNIKWKPGNAPEYYG